jgi:hypothetical protein
MARVSSNRQIRSKPCPFSLSQPKNPVRAVRLGEFLGRDFCVSGQDFKIEPPMQLRQPCIGGFGHGFGKALAYMGAAG